MNCPKCGGKIQTRDSVHNTVDNETYRKKRCLSCEHVFFTVEYEIENTADFARDWSRFYRTNLKGENNA